MIEYRTFRNTDPPAIADLWNSLAAEPTGLFQPMTDDLLEAFVFSKPYFDGRGVQLAVEDGKVVGFAHAGFAPTDDGADLSTGHGILGMVMVHPEVRRLGIGRELVSRSEAYLQSQGAQSVQALGTRPAAPFYWGLYSTGDLLGVLKSYEPAQALFEACGYQASESNILYECDLSEFRPKFSRDQMQIRRRTQVTAIFDPRPKSWWQACQRGGLEVLEFTIRDRNGGPPLGAAAFWYHEILSMRNNGRGICLAEVEVTPQERRQGMATFLLGEALRQLHSEHFSWAAAMAGEDNQPAHALLLDLGFQESDRGVVFRKQLEP